jgi:hypothetical protein
MGVAGGGGTQGFSEHPPSGVVGDSTRSRVPSTEQRSECPTGGGAEALQAAVRGNSAGGENLWARVVSTQCASRGMGRVGTNGCLFSGAYYIGDSYV